MSDCRPEDGAESARFLERLRICLDENTFVKLTLGKYRGKDEGIQRIQVRRLLIKGDPCLSFVYRYATKEITKNTTVADGVDMIAELLGDPFKSAHLFSLKEDLHIEFSRKGRCAWHSSPPSCTEIPSETHDREKARILDAASPFLASLGVTDEAGCIVPSMSRKWKQINKFLEVFDRAFTSSCLTEADQVHLVDFGAGKGYLTFAVHEYLTRVVAERVCVTGIELRDDLVSFCNGVASGLGKETLSFREGDIHSYSPELIDVMIALHACDTATDLAIHMGIRSDAAIIMCAPCCHKQIRPQMRVPPVIQPVLQFGVHLGQEADMVTDSLRAILLEAHGYRTQIFEFVSLEHTRKNKMLLAVKHRNKVDREVLLEKVAAVKAFYGIQTHYLETLLSTD